MRNTQSNQAPALLRWFRKLQCLTILFAMLFPLAGNAGWEVTFHDDFDGTSLDASKWKRSDLWGNQTLSGNGEKQCYLPTAFSQRDGILSIRAERRDIPAVQCKSAKFDLKYSSGMLTSAGCNRWEKSSTCEGLKSFSQAYGYFEIRAKMPKGKGFWPAFWLVPIDGSWPPEIDVVEILGSHTSKAIQTYHFKDPNGKGAKVGHSHSGSDFASGFHTFGIDWQPDKLIWYVDGKETYRFASNNITSKPMYLLMNLAVGGHWGGDPDAATPFPSAMEIDYVRVFRRINNGQPDDTPPQASSSPTGIRPDGT